MKTAMLDERRRLVMPQDLPARSAVTITQVDEETWVVKRAKAEVGFKMVAIKIVESLPDDPEWDKVEASLVSASIKPGEDR